MNQWLRHGCFAAFLAFQAFHADAATLVAFYSEPDERMFDGGERTLGPPEYEFETITFVPSQGVLAIRLRSVSGVGGIFTFEFAARPDETFGDRTHVAVERPMGAANPRIRASWDIRSCPLPGEGAFRVLEAEGPNNEMPTRLALDFRFRCPSTTGVLRGAIRINSDVPLTPSLPVAVAHGPRLVDEGDDVMLDGRWSWAGPSPIASYAWSQVSGPAVTFDGPSTATPRFIAVADPGALSPLVFELAVADGAGNVSRALTTVNAYDVAAPQTYMALQSEPGEYVLGGESYLYRDPDSPVVADFYNASRDSVKVEAGFLVSFSGPEGAPLFPDNYENATRFGFQSPTLPGLSIGGQGRGCNAELGRFTILEIESNPTTGALTKLAMDFERRCTMFPDSPARAFGQIRINSAVPRAQSGPIAAAGFDQLAAELATVSLDGRNSRPGADPIASWRWQQVSGPDVVIGGATQPQANFTAPALASGSVELQFDLTVTDSQGRTDSDRVRVTVFSATAPRNLLRIDGSRGDYIGQGVVETFDDYDGRFEFAQHVPGLVSFGFNAGPLEYGFEFAAPGRHQLTVDNFEEAEQGTDPSPRRPWFRAESSGRACNMAVGRFVVREIHFGPGGSVERFAVDLEFYCDGQNVPLLAALRYRSSVPLDVFEPTAAAGPDQLRLERDVVVLEGRNTMPGAGTVTGWRWLQLAGTPVTLAHSDESIATFIAPSVTAPGETLRFELQVTSSNGTHDTDEIEVVVKDKLSPRSAAYLFGRGEYIAWDQDHFLSEQDGEFRPIDLLQGRSFVRVYWLGVGDDWQFELYTADELTVGRYIDDTQAGIPGIAVSSGGRGCNITRGNFDVLDIAFDGEVVSRLALNFEQYCDHIQIPLRGKLRFNVSMPDAHAGPDLAANGRGSVTLVGLQSAASVGSLRTYQWRQVAGPPITLQSANTASASFVAPDVAAVTTLTFELTVTDDRGIDDSDIVAIEVSPAPALPAPPRSGGGGGGIHWLALAVLAYLTRVAPRRAADVRSG